MKPTNAKPPTSAEIATLVEVLRCGGIPENKLHMGRSCPGWARKTVVASLIAKGLLRKRGRGVVEYAREVPPYGIHEIWSEGYWIELTLAGFAIVPLDRAR